MNCRGVKNSTNISITMRICKPNIRYANKYDARNFLNRLFIVGGIWDSKISGGGWLEGIHTFIIAMVLKNFLENFLK